MGDKRDPSEKKIRERERTLIKCETRINVRDTHVPTLLRILLLKWGGIFIVEIFLFAIVSNITQTENGGGEKRRKILIFFIP